jgi:hypothetical protein
VDVELARLIDQDQYALPQIEKEPGLLRGMNRLTAHHTERCAEYARIIEATEGNGRSADTLADVPFLPVSLFKWIDLKSIPESEVFKVLISSGTTSQTPSRIFLDVETARLQTQALSSIVTHFIGHLRMPMLIVDHPGVVKDRRLFSARGAGILGMLSYGRDHFYLLDDDMRSDRAALETWLARHAGEELLIFGFTFMVWQYLYKPFRTAGIDVSRATLVHSGGWKKVADAGVTNEGFKSALGDAFGLTRVHNFYGMVEQVGSVFFECPAGYFHPPNFADVIIRDARTWQPSQVGDVGVVEVISMLPVSYPGHALLTEDRGILHGIDDCSCGRLGKRFTVEGRVPKAEIRGCSDTHEPAA